MIRSENTPHCCPGMTRRQAILLLLIFAVGITLRMAPLPHYMWGDSANYTAIAWHMAQDRSVIGCYNGPPHKLGEVLGPRAFGLRLGLTFPASLVLRFLPPTGLATAPPSFPEESSRG